MDLDTLRGESDQIALVDGQPVPGEIGREYARVRDLVAPAGHRPGRRAPPRLRHARPTCPTAAPLRPRPRRRLPHPRLHHHGRVTAADGPRRPRSPTGRSGPRTAAPSARPATSSRPPATPTSPTPRPTGPAPGSPPGANASTSHPDRSSRSNPTHHRSNRHHRHPTTRHPSEPRARGMSSRRQRRDTPRKNRGDLNRSMQHPLVNRGSCRREVGMVRLSRGGEGGDPQVGCEGAAGRVRSRGRWVVRRRTVVDFIERTQRRPPPVRERSARAAVVWPSGRRSRGVWLRVARCG